jgi:hypothetical protein
MVDNSTVLEDEDGDFSDWVEIYNGGSTPINLVGYGLSDDENDPDKWEFESNVIQPNEFLIVFCSDKDRTFGSELHTNFKLSGSDELILTNPQGSILDEKDLESSAFDVSMGYVVDGGGQTAEFFKSTPRNTNLSGIIRNKINPSREAGFYSDAFYLKAMGSEGHAIRFTLDGSNPTLVDPLWPDSLEIIDQSPHPNSISTIPTTADNLYAAILWEEPVSNLFKGTVVKLRSFEAGESSSHVQNLSYFIHPEGAERYSLPVVSLITDSLNLFQYDTGIYIPGYHHDIDPNGGHEVWGSGNYREKGEEWERDCHFQLFNNAGDLEVSQDVGIRIHGAGSTSYPQKSVRIYAKEKYGETKIERQLFPDSETDEFDVVVLRNMGQDFITGVAQDVLANQIARPLNQATLHFRPVITFVNGEYWGIQNLRERFDKHFLAQFHDSHKDSIDIIDSYGGGVDVGSNQAFLDLYNLLDNNDISIQSNYEDVASKMEIEDYIDNMLIRVYMGCYDWPGNNSKMWRERSADGKFRWLLLDNDGCLGNASYNSLEHATEPNGPGWPNPPQSTLFLRRLLENDDFKQQFISRMAELLNTSFDKNLVGYELSDLYEFYNGEYSEHQDRWSPLAEEATLEDNYTGIMEVLRVRACFVREHFMDYFSLSESEFPYTCDSSALYLNTNEIADVTDELLVFPVPNNGSFTAVFPQTMTGKLEVELYDLSGKLIFAEKAYRKNGNQLPVVTNGISPGVYTLRVSSETETHYAKLVIQ